MAADQKTLTDRLAAEAAARYAPKPAPALPANDDPFVAAKAQRTAPGQHHRVYTASELRALPRRPALIPRFLPGSGVAMIYGPSGSGKTFFALDIAAARAAGAVWNGTKLPKGKVVYVAAEAGRAVSPRIDAIQQMYPQRTDADLPVTDIDVPMLADAIQGDEFIEMMVALKADMYWIDTISVAAAGARENTDEMQLVMNRCRAISNRTGALVCIVGHSGKNSAKDHRGWSGVRAAVDAEIFVERIGETAARTWKVTKLRDGEDSREGHFQLKHVDIAGTDEGSCVVEHVAKAPKPKAADKAPTGRNQQAILAALEQLGPKGEKVVITDVVAQVLEDRGVKKGGTREQRRIVKQAVKSMADDGHIWIDGDTCSLKGVIQTGDYWQ